MTGNLHVYCGTTISAAEAAGIVPQAVIHPPVRHGDLLSLDRAAGLTVVIIDGLFHQVPAVRHKEILWLLAHPGVRVAGAASMGALRAAELHPYGMTGVGAVYQAYRDGTVTGDDEVAVAAAGDDYRPVSEALADVRAALRQAARDGAVGQAEAEAIAACAAAVHYADRSWPAIAAAAGPGLAAAMTRFGRWRASRGGPVPAKLADARLALHLAAAGTLPEPGPGAWTASRWGSCQLQDWLARYRGGPGQPPLQAILAHQQLYDPGFPRRWRRHVLSWAGGGGADGPARAVAAAEAAGLAVGYLSRQQAEYWLTPAELAGLDGGEQLARILVRAVPQDLTALVWPATAAQAGALIDPGMRSGHAVAEAARINADVARTGPHRQPGDLKASLIRAHLARAWMLSPADGTALTAAARDRGFGTIAAAVAAARPFFLRESSALEHAAG